MWSIIDNRHGDITTRTMSDEPHHETPAKKQEKQIERKRTEKTPRFSLGLLIAPALSSQNHRDQVRIDHADKRTELRRAWVLVFLENPLRNQLLWVRAILNLVL